MKDKGRRVAIAVAALGIATIAAAAGVGFLGSSWCSGDRPAKPDGEIVALTGEVNRKGGAITWDVPIGKDGRIPETFIAQLRAIGSARGRGPGEKGRG